MNSDRIDRTIQRLLLIAVVIHLYRDWGPFGGLIVIGLAAVYAFWREWWESKEAAPTAS